MAQKTNKANRQRIMGSIDNDIQKGVYDRFPALKNRLAAVSQSLATACYVINSEPLRMNEVKLLVENDYLDRHFLTVVPSEIF